MMIYTSSISLFHYGILEVLSIMVMFEVIQLLKPKIVKASSRQSPSTDPVSQVSMSMRCHLKSPWPVRGSNPRPWRY